MQLRNKYKSSDEQTSQTNVCNKLLFFSLKIEFTMQKFNDWKKPIVPNQRKEIPTIGVY